MAEESLKDNLWSRLREGNFNGIKGTNITFRVPVHVDLLNSILEKLVSSTDAMKDFRRIHFSDIGYNQFTVDVHHQKINKSIRAEIAGISYNQNSDPILTILFIGGIKFYEKIALDSALVFRKGLNWFKSAMTDTPEKPPEKGSWYELSSGNLKINLAGLLNQQNLDYLPPIVKWEKILADDNTIIIKFSIKT